MVYFLGRFALNQTGITEEGRVLLTIAQTAEAVEEKNRTKLAAVLSEYYSDRSGLDKASLLDLAQRFFSHRETIEIIRVSANVDFPEEGSAIGKIGYQVFGNVGGSLYRGFRDSATRGEKIIYRLEKEDRAWKIVAIDPEFGTWR